MFDAERYLRCLQSAVAKHYLDQKGGREPFRVIGLNCKVQTGRLNGKPVAVPRCCRDMEQVAFLAREQLVETLADTSGNLEFDPPTIDHLWNEGGDTENGIGTGEVEGHAFDIMNDARVWEAVAEAAIVFRRAAAHRDAIDTINKIKTPKTVAEARALRDARETIAA